MVEFRGTWIPMCHNCGTKAYRLTPLPQSLEGLTQRLGRDRRWTARRRGEEEERIRPKNRRQADRRALAPAKDEVWEDAEELIIEAEALPSDDQMSVHELTRIVKPQQVVTNKVSREATAE